jgi:DNA replication protein DnaC
MKNQPSLLSEQLEYLKLKYVADQYGPLADEAIRQPGDHREYLRRLIEGEYNDQRQRRVAARIKSARFPGAGAAGSVLQGARNIRGQPPEISFDQ